MKIRVKMTKKDGKVNYYRKVSSRRLLRYCSLVSWAKLYIWVGYGKDYDVHGKLVEFYNDAEFTDPKEARKTAEAFLEEYES